MALLGRRQQVSVFSNDSMTAAYGLLPGVLPGGWGVPPTRGTPEYLRAYSQMPWLRAVTGRIATSVANVEWRLWVLKGPKEPKARSGWEVRKIQRAPMRDRRRMLKQAQADDNLQPVVDNPALDVIKEANEFQTGFAMRKVTQLHIDIVGDAFWLKERDAQGMPSAVWPIPPHWIVSTPTPSFRFFRVSFRAWRGLIPDTEFVWFSDVDPLNPYARGSGSAMALGDELETDEYAARHSKAFFYNQAMPPLVIYPKGPNGVNPGNMRRLEEQWSSQSQGFFRSARPFFMNREVGIEQLEQNFRSQQFTQLREFERDVVLQHYGMPPEILGVLANSNRATIASADYFTGKYVTEPRVEFLRQVMQERFIPEFDERLILDYEPVVEEDNEYQLEAAKAQPGALTVDEWRAKMGYPPLDDAEAGKLHMVPQLVRIQKIEEHATAAELLAGQPPGTGPDGQPPPAPAVPARSGRQADIWESGVSAAVESGDVPLAETIAKLSGASQEGLAQAASVAARFEASLARGLVHVWREHAAGVSLEALRVGLGATGVHGDLVAELGPKRLSEAQTELLRPMLEACMLRGAEIEASALRRRGILVRRSQKKLQTVLDFDLINPLAVKWAKEHAGDLVLGDDDVREMVGLLVTDAVESGVTIDALAKVLRDVVGLTLRQVAAVAAFQLKLAKEGKLAKEAQLAKVAKYADAQLKSRALLIARTETMAAVNHGQLSMWKLAQQQGMLKTFGKKWIIADDDRLCDECEALDGEIVAIDESFSSGDDVPPAHPACRCATGLAELPIGKSTEPSRPKARVRTLQYDDAGRVVGMTEQEVS